jgi:tRNA modification GTPase
LAYQLADLAIAQAIEKRGSRNVPVLNIWNKTDLQAQEKICSGLGVSAKTGQGLDLLRKELLALAGWNPDDSGVFIARTRHVHAIERSRQHLALAQQYLSYPAPGLDVVAEELRLAQNAMNEVTGEFNTEDLLGEIFSKFCIGK